MIDRTEFWTVLAVLGAGTYLIRFSFLGFLGNRVLPVWLSRALRYTAVSVLPALVAPAVLWPTATGGQLDLARVAAGLVTLIVGALLRQMIIAIAAGALVLFLMQYLT